MNFATQTDSEATSPHTKFKWYFNKINEMQFKSEERINKQKNNNKFIRFIFAFHATNAMDISEKVESSH